MNHKKYAEQFGYVPYDTRITDCYWNNSKGGFDFTDFAYCMDAVSVVPIGGMSELTDPVVFR